MGKRSIARIIIGDKNIWMGRYPQIGWKSENNNFIYFTKNLICLANLPGSGYQEIDFTIFLIVHFVRSRAKKVVYVTFSFSTTDFYQRTIYELVFSFKKSLFGIIQ